MTGKVTDFLSNLVADATVNVAVNGNSGSVTTNNKGEYAINLADIGKWSAGDLMTVTAYKVRRGEETQTVVATSKFSQTVDLTLSQEDKFVALDPTTYIPLGKTILSDYEGKNYGVHYPLPVQISGWDFDLVNNPSYSFEVSSIDGQPESETITLSNGDVYKRTFSYTTISGNRVQTYRSKWVKQ